MYLLNIYIPPKTDSLMKGIFYYYRKRSLPSNFTAKKYLELSKSSGSRELAIYLGPGSVEDTTLFSTDSEKGSWIEVKMRNYAYITHYAVYQIYWGYDNRFRYWEFDGSNDGTTWEALDNYSINANTTMQEYLTPYLYTVQNPGRYKYIKLIVHKTAREDGSMYHLAFSGLDIFGSTEIEVYTKKYSKSINCLNYFLFETIIISK